MKLFKDRWAVYHIAPDKFETRCMTFLFQHGAEAFAEEMNLMNFHYNLKANELTKDKSYYEVRRI